MAESSLVRLFEHNTWANLRIIQACSGLSDEQLDAQPQSATKGSIRRTLHHLVDSQQHYLSHLTGVEPRFKWEAFPPFAELMESARISGEGLTELARSELSQPLKTPVRTGDNYVTEAWVIMVQVINHATEHREQINSMLSALGLPSQDMDGWTYGEAMGADRPAK